MGDYRTYVAMDVHARSVTAKALVRETGETATRKFGAGYTAAEIAGWAQRLGGPLYFAYESGCTGFWLARELRALGHGCDVIAVSTLAKTQKQRKGKCDRLDAAAILSEMLNPAPSYSCVFVPDEGTEGARDLCRLEQSLEARVKEARQELSAFLMRHGHVWDERTKTGRPRKPKGRAYEAWLNSISFEDWATSKTFSWLRHSLAEAQADLREVRKLVEEMARSPENRPYVEALTQVKGVGTVCAMAIVAEVGTFSRFRNGRSVSSWLGVVPSNSSSGEREAHGRITKCGNKYLRRRLTEGLAGISRWDKNKVAGPAGGVSPSVAACARACNRRISERYDHLANEMHKNPNKARTAVVSELARWVWVIGREVEREQAAMAS